MVTFLEIFFIFVFRNLGVLGCGTLKAYSEYEGEVAVGKIRLYPNSLWKSYIENKNYQWVRGKSRQTDVGWFSGGHFQSRDNRLSDEGMTLLIRGMTKSDEDAYRVGCFDPNDRTRTLHNWTADVQLTLPTERPTVLPPATTILLPSGPSTRPSAIEDLSGDSSGDVAVVVTMTVIIVVLILVILGLVIRMRVKNRLRQLDRRAIAKEEETQSSEERPQQGENVYNEIDDFAVMDPSITYAKVMETSLVGTHANLDTGESRNLPRRDDYRKEQLLTSQVKCGEYVHIKEEGVPKDVYSQVVPKALRQNQKTEEKTTRNEDKKHVNDKTDGEVKTTIRKPQRSTLKKSDVQYKSMECILVDTASNVSHEYANTLPRSIKRKGSKTKTELTYIQIDHGPERNGSDYAEIEPIVIGEAPESAYVSIDFDKKAFVAPIRKAPSSWYRKRKERKEKKKQIK